MADAFEHLSPKLQDRLARLPHQSGVYLLSDHDEKIIYVGKAKNLYSRVRSYFNKSGDDRAFIPLLGKILGDIETIVTQNEKEALLLENNLIKEHRPRFNVMMRDDKNFLVLRLDVRSEYPRLEVVRKIKNDGARYFGPYHSASACRQTLKVINRHFQLRTCTDRVMKMRSRPCLQYQIGRCPAPCVYEIDPVRYHEQIEDVSLFLKGNRSILLDRLKERMAHAAKELAFEKAATIRDQIEAVEQSLVKQQVVGKELIDQDVFSYYREGDAVDISLLILRQGRIVGGRTESFRGQEFPAAELLSSYINQYYASGAEIPKEVLTAVNIADREALEASLSDLKEKKVIVFTPQRGHKRKLIDLASENAVNSFKTRRSQEEDTALALAKLQKRLRMSQLPALIECYDISQFQGDHVVASMVVMRDGKTDPSSYRHFKIRGKTDDFSALYETLARRFRQAAHQGEKSKKGNWQLPDLIVIDGGKGQLSSALAALKDSQLEGEGPLIVGLAKERYGPNEKGEDRPDRIFLPNEKDPIRLNLNTAELYLLTQLRDEAHRFAITHHRKRRIKSAFKSKLDQIEGIGDARKKALLRHLGSVKAISEASYQQLCDVPAMNSKAAEAVYRYFHGKSRADDESC